MKLLVGFDESEGARDAVELAGVLGLLAGAEVVLVDVLPEEPVPVPYLVPSSRHFPPHHANFDAALGALPGAEVETRPVRGGSPAHVLHDLAGSEGADLVVVGSPRYGPLGRTFLGSVAEALLHGSPVPVAVAPRGYRGRRHRRPSTLAVAYDGGPESKLALAYTRALATGSGAAVRVLTVAEPFAAMPGLGGYAPPFAFDVERVLAGGLEALGPDLEKEGASLTGPPASALTAACAEGVDLLVTGSRGYGPLGRIFIGSAAASLICRSPCPVLVVPRHREGER